MDTTTRQAWHVNKYLWMTLAGVLLYLVVASWQGLLRVPVGAAWAIFGLAIVNGAARSLIALRRGGNLPSKLAVAFNLLDISMATLAVSVTGGIESDLWLLYFVFMSFEAFYATPRQKRRLDIAVVIAYFIATLPHQFPATSSSVAMPVFWRLLCTRLFFLILVSALGRRTFANEAERTQEILLLREQAASGEERARIAREVHDGLGHALVSIILRLELAARLITRAPDEAETILKEEIPALRAAWNESRDLAFHLRPWGSGTGEGDDLATILRRHCGRFAERTGLHIRVDVTNEIAAPDPSEAADTNWRLRPAVMHGVTRIVQEALTNIAKHAQAESVDITLCREASGGLTCVIQDDGIGFDSASTAGGVGLNAMRERVTSLGGQLSVTTHANSGTRIELIIFHPL